MAGRGLLVAVFLQTTVIFRVLDLALTVALLAALVFLHAAVVLRVLHLALSGPALIGRHDALLVVTAGSSGGVDWENRQMR